MSKKGVSECPENTDFIYSASERLFMSMYREYVPPMIQMPTREISETANLKAQAEGNPTLSDSKPTKEKVVRENKLDEWRKEVGKA